MASGKFSRVGVCSSKLYHYPPARIPLAVLFTGDSSSFMKMTPLLPVLVALAAAPLCHAAEKPAKPVVAVYDLEGVLSESGQPEAAMFDFSFDASLPLTLLDLTRSLEKAAADANVKAVVMDADGAGLGFAQIQEIRRRLLAVREAGKDVWIYTEGLNNGTALLGSAANHFTLMPEADCSFSGIHAESMYLKGLLDKAGVSAEVIHIGDFKSFGEMFYREGPSEEAKQQEEQLIDDVFRQLVADVAAGRKLTPEAVEKIIDDGSLNAKDMAKNGMADHLLHRTDFVKKVRETYGEDAKYDRGYELPDLDGPEITGIMDILKLAFAADPSANPRKDFVAVVALEGDITDESVAPVRSQILKLAKQDKAKALVLRVNSPGGSALASEVLWEAADEWKATGKPFVVSMGGVAASGGYYVACGADRIFAEAGTITGSIGVVGMKFVVGGAMEKLGITTHSTQRGKNAGAMSMMRAFTPEEAGLVRKSMEDVYATFKKRVTDGRRKALKGDLEPLAGGRVYSGTQALGIGLVDEIGGLTEAIAHASKAAKLKDPDVRLLPAPKAALDGLFSKPEKEDDEMIRATRADAGAAGLLRSLKNTGLLEALPAPTRSALSKAISRIEAFSETRVLMLGPEINLN
jgi:protease IV